LLFLSNEISEYHFKKKKKKGGSKTTLGAAEGGRGWDGMVVTQASYRAPRAFKT
jgi:hypothetical protein